MRYVGTLQVILFGVISCTMFFSIIITPVFADDVNSVPELYEQANRHLMNGQIRDAVILYDKILEISPDNFDVILMKGIALSNLEQHKQSMKELYKALENDPRNISAMIGLGVGFGNYGEYQEAQKYFNSAYSISPENHVIINYKNFADKTVKKYPYNEVEKPEIYKINIVEDIPSWVKNTAGWWAGDQIEDSEFIKSIQFLIENKIIKINSVVTHEKSLQTIPEWVKNTAGWWAGDQIEDSEFLAGLHFLIENGILVIEFPDAEKLSKEEQKIADRNRWQFERYLDRVEKTVYEDKRYIEYPNPSNDVIKKFLRDYSKWNFDQQLEIGNKSFPDPAYKLVDDVYHIEYKIYINDQPHGLPLDHVGTLVNSFKYWENQKFTANDGNPVSIHFVTTKSKADANLWVTWVVRDIGENVLGHANLGKGVIEVALGGYGCDGTFQLFHVNTVEIIMTHELGHGIGLLHSTDPESIMYPTIKKTMYAYCLLDINN